MVAIAARVSKIGVVVAVFMAVLLLPVLAGGRSSADARYKCGSQCNNKPADLIVTGQKFTCSQDARVQSNGSPTAKIMGAAGFNDTNLKITVMYSPRCQTMWAKVTNLKAIGRSWTVLSLNSTLSSYHHEYTFPAQGSTVTTNMIDDHSPTYGIAAAVDVEDFAHGQYSRYYFSY